MLSHDVYFTLKQRGDEPRAALVAACRKYLSGHPGQVFFAVGTLAEEYTREVNDRDYDVALHVVFATNAEHDAYQTAPRHLQFIEENRDVWATVRVFDSEVEGA